MKILHQAILVGALGATTAAPTIAFADDVDDAILARRGYFQMIEFNMGQIVKMARGAIDYDAGTAKALTGNLQALSSIAVDAMWPEGSDNEAKSGDTRALPALWSDFDGFTENQEAFSAAVAELDSVAGDGLDELKSKIRAVGASCNACHKAYRAKKF